jgi:hypothetical protein
MLTTSTTLIKFEKWHHLFSLPLKLCPELPSTIYDPGIVIRCHISRSSKKYILKLQLEEIAEEGKNKTLFIYSMY